MVIETDIDRGSTTIRPEGKLTVQTSPELNAAVEQLPDGICDLDIDLSGVDYIASAGLRVLMAADKAAMRRGGKMRLLHPGASVMEALEMTGLAEAFAIER